jgi:hypothetical protein
MRTTATVMFNGSLYSGELLRETPKRLLVKFTTGTGTTREGWFTRVTPPDGVIVGRRSPLLGREPYVTIPANSGFVVRPRCD